MLSLEETLSVYISRVNGQKLGLVSFQDFWTQTLREFRKKSITIKNSFLTIDIDLSKKFKHGIRFHYAINSIHSILLLPESVAQFFTPPITC